MLTVLLLLICWSFLAFRTSSITTGSFYTFLSLPSETSSWTSFFFFYPLKCWCYQYFILNLLLFSWWPFILIFFFFRWLCMVIRFYISLALSTPLKLTCVTNFTCWLPSLEVCMYLFWTCPILNFTSSLTKQHIVPQTFFFCVLLGITSYLASYYWSLFKKQWWWLFLLCSMQSIDLLIGSSR